MREVHVRVLGINGSPREGNSLFLLGEALQAAREETGKAETGVFLSGEKVFPLRGLLPVRRR